MFTEEEGKTAVKLARLNIERELGRTDVALPDIPDSFKERSGVFVTLKRYPGSELRGCIGYVEPIMPLGKALLDVSLSSALRDPRFPPVHLSEMDSLVLEVTLLTSPKKIDYRDPDDLVKKVTIGKDGLIAKRSFLSGLLLPQVPVEWGWDVEEFLSHTCSKAGMSMDAWRKGNVQFQKFSGIVFGEVTPRGEIKEMELS